MYDGSCNQLKDELQLRGGAQGLYRHAGSREIQARGSIGSDSALVRLVLAVLRASCVSRSRSGAFAIKNAPRPAGICMEVFVGSSL